MEDDRSKHDSCEGCRYDLGGGQCRINLEGECSNDPRRRRQDTPKKWKDARAAIGRMCMMNMYFARACKGLALGGKYSADKEDLSMSDVLTRKQLMEQLQRRRAVLDKLMAGGAPRAAIEEARKKLLLTERRLERMDAAAVLAGDCPPGGNEDNGEDLDGGGRYDEL